ncbi:MAG: TetR/AcrR family transcriptional regulator [Alphaproteobacteria bacterium]|nr:TetR/AcrR family transcriptional regulator [Alphaproteobacteria bacterium]MCB9695799.1 TetR/AcrR family transcriptional regulator [Alphaproteobacteria bacterium]
MQEVFMPRPKGRRNHRFEERRREIAGRIGQRLIAPDGARASLRELAAAAGVSLPTLRHYFGDRDGVLAAAVEELGRTGAFWLQATRSVNTELALGPSMRWLLDMFAIGWERGVGTMMSSGLAAGLESDVVGPAVVDALLEPMLQATETRLAEHAARGEVQGDLRHAALALVCPALLALMHQHGLRGASCRPLDLARFLDEHTERFVLGWGR